MKLVVAAQLPLGNEMWVGLTCGTFRKKKLRTRTYYARALFSSEETTSNIQDGGYPLSLGSGVKRRSAETLAKLQRTYRMSMKKTLLLGTTTLLLFLLPQHKLPHPNTPFPGYSDT